MLRTNVQTAKTGKTTDGVDVVIDRAARAAHDVECVAVQVEWVLQRGGRKKKNLSSELLHRAMRTSRTCPPPGIDTWITLSLGRGNTESVGRSDCASSAPERICSSTGVVGGTKETPFIANLPPVCERACRVR